MRTKLADLTEWKSGCKTLIVGLLYKRTNVLLWYCRAKSFRFTADPVFRTDTLNPANSASLTSDPVYRSDILNPANSARKVKINKRNKINSVKNSDLFVTRLQGIVWKTIFSAHGHFRCGSRIWSRGVGQLLRPKIADVAKRGRASEASNLWPGSRARLRALEAFGFLMLKYAFSHILETLFLSFLTSILTPNVDKNRALEITSINLRHSYILHLFFNLHEKVML